MHSNPATLGAGGQVMGFTLDYGLPNPILAGWAAFAGSSAAESCEPVSHVGRPVWLQRDGERAARRQQDERGFILVAQDVRDVQANECITCHSCKRVLGPKSGGQRVAWGPGQGGMFASVHISAHEVGGWWGLTQGPTSHPSSRAFNATDTSWLSQQGQ